MLLELGFLLLILLAIVGLIAVVVILLSRREERRQKANRALRKEILENGRRGEATVMYARVTGDQFRSERRALVTGKFNIKIPDTGEEYVLSRKWLAVPQQYVPELKGNNVLPVTVHRDNRQLVLFDFDKTGPVLDITFVDP